jgi:hypothetical protein
VAKIERKHNKEVEWMDRQGYTEYHQGLRDGYANILSCLGTIKVKEVDLEKEFDRYCDNLYLIDLENEPYAELFECAKHFFELGLKAHKL